VVLRAFDDISVQAGEKATFKAKTTQCDVSNWDLVGQNWVFGKYPKTVYVGASSRKLWLKAVLQATGLRGNSLVCIENKSQSFISMTPANATESIFHMAGLLPGTISTTQELCGIASVSSKSIRHSESVPVTEMIGVLFDCARNMMIRKVYPRAMIQVFSMDSDGHQSPTSDQWFTNSTSVIIPMSLWLQYEWKAYRLLSRLAPIPPSGLGLSLSSCCQTYLDHQQHSLD